MISFLLPGFSHLAIGILAASLIQSRILDLA